MRKTISAKEWTAEFQRSLPSVNFPLTKKDHLELHQENNRTIVLLNKKPSFAYHHERVYPHLKLIQDHPSLLKTIVVDAGAVKFIIHGADVMRPGITEIAPHLQREELVTILEQTNRRPIAIGIALYITEEMQALTTGKVVRNIHYLGDELWKYEP